MDVAGYVSKGRVWERPYEVSDAAKRSKRVLRRWAKDFETAHTNISEFGDIKVGLSFAKDARTNWLNSEHESPRAWRLSIEWRPFGTADAHKMSVWLGWEREKNSDRHTWEEALKAVSEGESIISDKYFKMIANYGSAQTFARKFTNHATAWKANEALRVQSEIEREALLKNVKGAVRDKSFGNVL